jgi:hypothetical protein
MFMLTWGGGATLGRNFGVSFGTAEWEVCSATWNLGTNSTFVLGPRKTTFPIEARVNNRLFKRLSPYRKENNNLRYTVQYWLTLFRK